MLQGGFIVTVTLFLKLRGDGNKRVNIMHVGQFLATDELMLVALALTVKFTVVLEM
jgi:hypothetical protein